MFEKFTSMGANDFKQRYAGTYGFFTDDGKKTLIRLNRINVDDRKPFVEFVDRNGLEYKLLSDSSIETRGFEFIPPKSCYYNTKQGIPYLVHRIPARQYQRGLCDKNTAITDLLGRDIPVDFANIATLFEDKTSTEVAWNIVQEKLKTGNKECLGIAISPQFALCMTRNQVYCIGQPIGTFTYKEGLFSISLKSSEMWGTEITDAFRRSRLNMVINK